MVSAWRLADSARHIWSRWAGQGQHPSWRGQGGWQEMAGVGGAEKESVVLVEFGNLPGCRAPGGWVGLEMQRERESWFPRAVGV